MTTDELRDRLAGLCGWQFEPGARWIHPDLGGRPPSCHPFPPNDYNALIAAWPEDEWMSVHWDVERRMWLAIGGAGSVDGYEAPTRYEAELRLTVAVLEANRP